MPRASPHEGARIFVVRLRAAAGGEGIRGLRRLLKRLGRSFGLVCTDAREERPKKTSPK